jgi:MFS family permease
MEKLTTYPNFRWYILLMVTIAVVAQGMMLIAPTPLVGVIAESMNVGLGAITAALMMPFTLLVAIGGIASGILMDKIGIYKTFLMGTAIAAIAGALTPAAGDSLGALIALRALQGLGCGPLIASGPKVAAEWFPPAQRGVVQGVLGAALSLGITIGLMAGPQIAAKSGSWTTALLFFGIVMAVAFVLIALSKLGPSAPVVERLETGAGKGEIKKVMGTPLFWMTFICVFALSWVMQGYNDLTPGHLAVPAPAGLDLGPEIAGKIMGIYTLAFMVGSLISGFVAEKIFKGNYKLAITVAFVLTAIFCFSVTIPAINGSQAPLMICLILAGFFMGMPMPIAQTSISNFYPEHLTGSVGGITMGLGIFGGTVGVAAGSAALHATGMYMVSIIIVCVVALIGAAAGFGVKRPKTV